MMLKLTFAPVIGINLALVASLSLGLQYVGGGVSILTSVNLKGPQEQVVQLDLNCYRPHALRMGPCKPPRLENSVGL